MLLEIFVALLTGTLVFVLYVRYHYGHWKRKNVPHLPYRIPFGHMRDSFKGKESSILVFKKIYDAMKRNGHKHCGTYYYIRPMYFPLDPEIIKNILTKDFHHFTDRGLYVNEKVYPLTGNLLRLQGQKWKNMRKKLTPTFTSAKMKWMFNILVETGQNLLELIDREISANENNLLDVRQIASRYNLDVIGSCAFGIDINSLKNSNSDFLKYHKKLTAGGLNMAIFGMLVLAAPRFLKLFNPRFITKETESFYRNFVKEMVEYREKNNVRRQDFLQMLIDLKNKRKLSPEDEEFLNLDSEDVQPQGQELTMDELTAQVFVFFIAGFDTSAITIHYALYELAVNETIQERLRQEISASMDKHEDRIVYETINEMPYLDKIIKETVRKYPPAPHLNRECTSKYKVPGTDLVLGERAGVIISVFALHRDPQFYPEPERFDPDRFSEEEVAKRNPFVYLPFGYGPRSCIGERFGVMQTKIALIILIRHYRFTTTSDEPIRFTKRGFLLNPEKKIMLLCEKIRD